MSGGITVRAATSLALGWQSKRRPKRGGGQAASGPGQGMNVHHPAKKELEFPVHRSYTPCSRIRANNPARPSRVCLGPRIADGVPGGRAARVSGTNVTTGMPSGKRLVSVRPCRALRPSTNPPRFRRRISCSPVMLGRDRAIYVTRTGSKRGRGVCMGLTKVSGSMGASSAIVLSVGGSVWVSMPFSLKNLSS